jgi:hypothetical protein
LRAVLWQWAGCGLPRPQAKAPPTLARRVILFGPESWPWGSGYCALRVGGVGRRNGRLHCWVRTPPRKIRCRFHEYKHTWLIFVVDKFCELRFNGVLGSSDASFVIWSTYCAGAHTLSSYRSMLPSLRGHLRPREGAGPLPAPPLNLGPPPYQSYYLPPHTYTHLGRMCARRG